MRKQLTTALMTLFAVICLSPCFIAYASDTPFDGGGGGTGQGNYDNGWVVSPGIYDADGIRVYLVQGGTDADGNEIGNGHRITTYEKDDVKKVIKKLDLTNYDVPSAMWNSGMTKSDYKYNGIKLGASGTWHTIGNNPVYNYQPLDVPNKLPPIVGWGETATKSETRIEAIKNWFIADEKKNWNYVLELLGTTGDEATDNQWYLAFEPVIYFRYHGSNYALTPTECAVLNQYLTTSGEPDVLSRRMGPLTHQNAPLSIYPTTSLFKANNQHSPAWTGAKSTVTNISDENIKTYLGIGYVLPPKADVVPEPITPPELKLNAEMKAEPDDYEIKGSPGIAASLGENAVVTVNIKQSPAEIKKWEARLKNAANIGVHLTITSDSGRTLKCETPAIKSYNFNGSGNLVTKEELFKLFNTTLIFTDPCASETIMPDEEIEYKYTFTIKVSFNEAKEFENPNKYIVISANELSDTASYFRKDDPPPEIVSYTSNPVTYSEIKQGVINSEQFEAMAGTPTTRDLYFSTGGSEFIVDFEAQLLKNNTATRTYRVHYDGIECEFKEGDQSKDFTFPSPAGGGSGNYSISSMHSGGSCSVTWSGTTKYTGTPVFNADKTSVTLTEVWDDTAYDAAKASAQAYAASVNGTVYSYTAASDKETRTKSGWGAGITADSNTHIKGSVTQGSPEVKEVKDKDGKVTTPYKAKVEATYTLGSDNSWTITVSWTVPAHTCCGPCHTHDLPAVNDTWTQEITYDYFDITKAAVWKIEQGYLDGLSTITGTNSVLTQILQGNPTIFSNIAATETSRDGRFRYSVEPQMHDAVVWNKGARSNKCDKQGEAWGTGIKYNVISYPHEAGYLVSNASAKDKLTAEYAEFKLNREKLVEVTVISDLLVLQTSSGDQSVLYFDKTSNKVQTQADYASVEVSKSEAWDNNTKSAARWSASHINTGSYNGKYGTPAGKYTGSGSNNKIAVKFDSDPANTITRTARPSGSLRIAKYAIDIIDTLPNSYYETGTARTFWGLALDYNPNGKSLKYSTAAQSLFGNKKGYVKKSNYSPAHTKINDIVIHNPVSAEYALILETDTSRDQRTIGSTKWAENAAKSNNECHGNPAECEYRYLSCKYTGTNTHTADCYTAVTEKTLNSHNHTVSCINTAKMQEAFQYVSGSQTFNYTGSVQMFTAPATGTYTLETWGAQGGGSIGGSGGYAKGTYNLTAGQIINIYVGGQPTGTTGGWNGGGSASSNARGGGGATDIRVGGTSPANRIIVAGGGGGAGFYGVGSINGGDSGEYQGGIGGGVNGGAGTGAYATVGFGGGTLISDTGIGASGQGGGGGGGYNGGGAGSFTSTSGVDWGGDFFCSGGGGSGYTGGVNGGTMQSGVNSGNGKAVISYTTNQYVGEAWGLIDLDEIFTGGNIQATDIWLAKQPKNAVIFNCQNAPNAHICSVACSHTPVLICSEPHHGGEHYDITNETCWSACHNDENHHPKATTIGGGAAGYFINLDWGFQVYFPTIGNFYEGEAYGISGVTRQRGKGFINNMQTAEWVNKKRVMFTFDVIYCGETTARNPNGSQHGNTYNGSDNHKHTSSCKLYKAGEWIDLPKSYELFNFYCISSNGEIAASTAVFEVIAINSPNGINDNTDATNRYRGDMYTAKHGAEKTAYTDVVGRIGNLVMEDTGDYRYSNLFKMPVAGNSPEDWRIQGILKKIDKDSKNYVLAGTADIRGLSANSVYGYDTYGLLTWLRNNLLSLPLSPDKNNVQALKNEPLRFGYKAYMDISTLGDEYDAVEIIPHYYYYNLITKTAVPVDVYSKNLYAYEPISTFKHYLDWSGEAAFRNVKQNETALTETLAGRYGLLSPQNYSKYLLGAESYMLLSEKTRTFIGSSSTMGYGQNLNGALAESDFQKAVKRWHFTIGLPSSAVVVDAGAEPTEANINKYKNSGGVVLMAAEIYTQSGLYTLEYINSSGGSFTLSGVTYTLPTNIKNVIAVYGDNGKSARDDLQISKTH